MLGQVGCIATPELEELLDEELLELEDELLAATLPEDELLLDELVVLGLPPQLASRLATTKPRVRSRNCFNFIHITIFKEDALLFFRPFRGVQAKCAHLSSSSGEMRRPIANFPPRIRGHGAAEASYELPGYWGIKKEGIQ